MKSASHPEVHLIYYNVPAYIFLPSTSGQKKACRSVHMRHRCTEPGMKKQQGKARLLRTNTYSRSTLLAAPSSADAQVEQLT